MNSTEDTNAADRGSELTEGLGLALEVADAARVLAWAREKPRRPANSAFTAGPERQAAYWIEWAEAAERERCARIVDIPAGTEAWEVIGGEEGLTMLRELAAQIRGA